MHAGVHLAASRHVSGGGLEPMSESHEPAAFMAFPVKWAVI